MGMQVGMLASGQEQLLPSVSVTGFEKENRSIKEALGSAPLLCWS